MSSAWIGPALGTTALGNYDVRVVARAGGEGFLWVSMLAVARGFETCGRKPGRENEK